MMEILKPTNVKEVQLLNGFVHHMYLAKFLPNLLTEWSRHTTNPLELRFAYRICTKRTCHLEPVCQIPTMRKRRNLKYVNLKGVKYKIQYIGEIKSMRTIHSTLTPHQQFLRTSARACLHGGGGPQVGEGTRFGGVTRLFI